MLQGQFIASCPALQLLEVTLQPGTPSLTPLIDMLNAPDWSKITNCYGGFVIYESAREAR